MARCPLCSQRSAKRYCPAKATQICPICCGSKREVEIDCPSTCPHLKSGREYEAGKRPPDPGLAARVQHFDNDFLERFSHVLDHLSRAVVIERQSSPWLVDSDVVEVYKALAVTMKTLESGILYESLPEGSVRISLYHRLKTQLDELMQPQADAGRHALRVSEALQVLDFLVLAATANSSARPKSRQYLDWITGMAESAAPERPSSRLILP